MKPYSNRDEEFAKSESYRQWVFKKALEDKQFKDKISQYVGEALTQKSMMATTTVQNLD